MVRRALVCLALSIALLASTAEPAGTTIAVIVHPSRKLALRVEDAARIFLRKQRFWDDGAPIVPLNREAGSELREAFSIRVFGVPSAALASYWNEQYFLGTLPPATLSSSAAVERYVSSEKNAIGYVEAAGVGAGVWVALHLEA